VLIIFPEKILICEIDPETNILLTHYCLLSFYFSNICYYLLILLIVLEVKKKSHTEPCLSVETG